MFFLYTLSFTVLLLLMLFFLYCLHDRNNKLIIQRIFLITEFGFLTTYYSKVIVIKYKTSILLFSIFAFVTYSIFDFLGSKSGEFSFMPLVVECFFFIIIIIFFLYQRMLYAIDKPIFFLPNFWIAVAFLLYFSGNFFLFLFSKTMFQNPDFKIQYTFIYSSITIIKNILISAGIFVNSNFSSSNQKGFHEVNIDLNRQEYINQQV